MMTNKVKNIPVKAKKATGSIAHAVEILICLSNDIHKVSDIARQCDFSKSTVHRVLKLLEQPQLVVQDTINRRYYLGPLVTRLASNAITTHRRLITYAEFEMQRLSSITGETVALDIMVGMQYLSLHEIPSPHNLRVTQESKKIGPLYTGLYAGASVKVLLAQLDENRLKVLMDMTTLTPVTERTITDKQLLTAQLQEIRRHGYAVSRGERIPGTICAAVPVNNYILLVGLSVVGPDSRLQSRIRQVVVELKTSSRRISKSIAGIFGDLP